MPNSVNLLETIKGNNDCGVCCNFPKICILMATIPNGTVCVKNRLLKLKNVKTMSFFS